MCGAYHAAIRRDRGCRSDGRSHAQRGPGQEHRDDRDERDPEVRKSARPDDPCRTEPHDKPRVFPVA